MPSPRQPLDAFAGTRADLLRKLRELHDGNAPDRLPRIQRVCDLIAADRQAARES